MTANERIALKLIENHFDDLSLEQIAKVCELDIEVVQKMLNNYQSDLMQHNMLVQTLFSFIQNENYDDAQETLDLMKIRKIKKDKQVDFVEAEEMFKKLSE
ncbi:hypothetical protein [Bacillus cereus group sp. BfR-BA-01353]|uniref:hypothetical protein n=1 Tax=Bacillus cereus group sp. BfR-BA-01353 TaxID=2920316 RepID=UPI001F57267F|nr:hypothetical protein [Bacillus cereus group sp. BfR-BA-01353]